jgi:hypothetical protein
MQDTLIKQFMHPRYELATVTAFQRPALKWRRQRRPQLIARNFLQAKNAFPEYGRWQTRLADNRLPNPTPILDGLRGHITRGGAQFALRP